MYLCSLQVVLLFKKNLLSGMMSGIKNIIGGIGKMGSGLMSKVSGGGGAW